MNDLFLEIMTLKVMVWSLAKSLNSNVKELSKWEKECKKIAKKILKEDEKKYE